jgi:HlyD family secretion protein/adhesin transport system membrane fusion protein
MKIDTSSDVEAGNGTGEGAVAVVRGSRAPRHLSEPSVVEQERLPTFVRLALLTIAGLFVAFVAWAAVVRIDEVATAPGQVVPSGTVKLVQHLEGGVVSDVKVVENQRVREGDVLMTFDPAAAGSELGQMVARYVGLIIRGERLKAVIEKREPDLSDYRIEYPKLVADQLQIWRSQMETRRSALSVIDSQIAQRTKEISQRSDMLAIAERNLRIATEELGIREAGEKSGVVARQIVLETKRAQVTAEGEVLRLREEIQLAKDALQEAERRKANLDNQQRQEALDELGTVVTEQEQVKNALGKLQDRVMRLEVRAPATGIVQELKVHTKGEVVIPGGLLMRVVPLDDVLEAHVRISPNDVGHVHPGDPVKLKVSSYEFTRFGTLDGTLREVSATTFAEDTTATPTTNNGSNSKVYYLGIVRLAHNYVGKNENENLVLPGMAVDVNIVTGEKTLLQYVLGPVYRALANAFKER